MSTQNTNSGKAVKAGIGYTIGNILVKGLSFVSVVIFSRLLTTAEFGEYNTYSAYTSIMFVVVGLALHCSIKNANVDFPAKLNSYISSLTILVIFSTGALLVIALVLSRPLGELLALAKPILVPIIVLDSFFLSLIAFYNSVLAVQYSYKEYLVIALLYAVVGIAVSVGLVFLFPAGERYMGRILGTLISAGCVSAYILARIYCKAKPRVNVSYWRYALVISLPIVPHGISQILLSQFDRLMIKARIGSSEAGLYSFAYTIATIFSVVASSLDTAWTQWFFDQMQAGKEEEIRKTANYYEGIVTLGAIMLMLVSPELIILLGGKKYMDCKAVVPPIVLAMFFSFMYYMPATVEYYYKKTKLIAIGTMLAAVLNIILNLLFIPRYGYVAAAYTTVVCYLLYYILHVLFAKHVHRKNLYNVRIQFQYIILVSLMMFFVVWRCNDVITRMLVFSTIVVALLVLCLKYKNEIMKVVRKMKRKGDQR